MSDCSSDVCSSVLTIAYRLGLAYAERYSPRRVAIGRDVRESSPMLARALSLGLTRGGAEVLDLGLCGTEEVYFAAFQDGVDGGVMVTASHNPIEYNGLKLVRAGARPISGDRDRKSTRLNSRH